MLLIRDLTLRTPDLVQLIYTEYQMEMILCEAQPELRPPDFYRSILTTQPVVF